MGTVRFSSSRRRASDHRRHCQPTTAGRIGGGRARGWTVLHYLPARSPRHDRIERVWWRLHEQITRNHRCQSIEELVDLALAWLTDRKYYKVQDAAYLQPKP